MKRLLALLVTIALCGSVSTVSFFAEAVTEDMYIHALFLGDEGKGDSTLIESNGKYLLVDCGTSESGDTVVTYLKSLGITELDVFISHVHTDHRGGLGKVAKNFTVNTLYLPSRKYASENDGADVAYSSMEEHCSQSLIRYLSVGDKFSFGSVSAEIIGPVGSFKLSQFEDTSLGTQLGHYINNYSLCTVFKSGDVKFLSCGDIEAEEETLLLKEYSDAKLRADIYKLSHHGLKTSNTEDFVDTVKPTYSFEENCSHAGVAENGYYKTYTPKKNVTKYGICVMSGEEKSDFVFHIKNGRTDVYRYNTLDENRLNNWVQLRGGDGTDEIYDYYYLNDKNQFLKGMNKIGNSTYLFDLQSGRRINGTYSDHKYAGWRAFDGKYRYFEKTGEMKLGFTTINSKLYYFDGSGFRTDGGDGYKIVTINGKKYGINASGVIYKNGWKQYEGEGGWRYFNKSGVMASGFVNLSGKSYHFDETTGITSNGLKNINGHLYYMYADKYGAIYKNGWYYDETAKGYRYCTEGGVVKIGWFTVDGKRYYSYPETGLRAKGMAQINGKKYYFVKKNNAGYMYKGGWLKCSDGYRYFDKSTGIMKTGWLKIGKKKYYLDTSTGLRYEGYKTVNGNKYYFSKTSNRGNMYKNKWKKYGSKGYRYYGSNGIMYKGLRTIKGKRYYFKTGNGVSVSGVKTVSGRTYLFNPSAKKHPMLTSTWYNGMYFGTNGIRRSGWMTLQNGRYYIDGTTNKAVSGLREIDGKLFFFGEDKILKTKCTYDYNGVKIKFGTNGTALGAENLSTSLVGCKKSGNKAVLSWKKCAKASGYEIYVADESGNFLKYGEISGGGLTYTTEYIKNVKDCIFTVRPYITVKSCRLYGTYSGTMTPK